MNLLNTYMMFLYIFINNLCAIQSVWCYLLKSGEVGWAWAWRFWPELGNVSRGPSLGALQSLLDNDPPTLMHHRNLLQSNMTNRSCPNNLKPTHTPLLVRIRYVPLRRLAIRPSLQENQSTLTAKEFIHNPLSEVYLLEKWRYEWKDSWKFWMSKLVEVGERGNREGKGAGGMYLQPLQLDFNPPRVSPAESRFIHTWEGSDDINQGGLAWEADNGCSSTLLKHRALYPRDRDLQLGVYENTGAPPNVRIPRKIPRSLVGKAGNVLVVAHREETASAQNKTMLAMSVDMRSRGSMGGETCWVYRYVPQSR